MFAKDAEIIPEAVLFKLSSEVGARGQKRTDRKAQIEFLHVLVLS